MSGARVVWLRRDVLAAQRPGNGLIWHLSETLFRDREGGNVRSACGRVKIWTDYGPDEAVGIRVDTARLIGRMCGYCWRRWNEVGRP